MSKNIISNPFNPHGVPLINENIQVLNKFSQIDGKICYNGIPLAHQLKIIGMNNGNIKTISNNVSTIIIEGDFDVSLNNQNDEQVIITSNIVADRISQLFITQLNSITQIYNLSKNEYLICNNEKQLILNLPPNVLTNDIVKIATLSNISQINKITIKTSKIIENGIQLQTYIDSKNNQQLIIDTPYSSVELIFDRSNLLWKVLTPFVPMDRIKE